MLGLSWPFNSVNQIPCTGHQGARKQAHERVHGSEVASVTGRADNLKKQLPCRASATKLRRQPFAPTAQTIKLLLERDCLFETLLKTDLTKTGLTKTDRTKTDRIAFRWDCSQRLQALLGFVFRHTDHRNRETSSEEKPKQSTAKPSSFGKVAGEVAAQNHDSKMATKREQEADQAPQVLENRVELVGQYQYQ